MAKRFTLGKKERLKSRKQIEQLFNEGKNFAVYPFRIYYLLNSEKSMVNSQGNVKFGAGVSGKNFKKAVDRNRIKRLIREAWRLQNSELQEKLETAGKQLNLFFIYTGKELPGFTLVKDKVAVALKKLSGKIDEINTADS